MVKRLTTASGSRMVMSSTHLADKDPIPTEVRFKQYVDVMFRAITLYPHKAQGVSLDPKTLDTIKTSVFEVLDQEPLNDRLNAVLYREKVYELLETVNPDHKRLYEYFYRRMRSDMIRKEASAKEDSLSRTVSTYPYNNLAKRLAHKLERIHEKSGVIEGLHITDMETFMEKTNEVAFNNYVSVCYDVDPEDEMLLNKADTEIVRMRFAKLCDGVEGFKFDVYEQYLKENPIY